MSKAQRRREPLGPTKKQVRLSRREQQQRRLVLILAGAVLVIVAGLLAGGILYDRVYVPSQPVLEVTLSDGSVQRISTRDFQKRVRFQRAQLIQQMNLYASLSPQYAQQFQQQLADTQGVGDMVLTQMADEILIRDEAKKRGISVSAEEVQLEVEKSFGYQRYTPTPTVTPVNSPTPTRTPTNTPIPTATATLTATRVVTQTATPTGTPGPTRTPFPTSTPITEQGFKDIYTAQLKDWSAYGITDQDIHDLVEVNLLRTKLSDELGKTVDRQADQVSLQVVRYTTQISATSVISAGLTPEKFDALFKLIDTTQVLSATASTVDWTAASDLSSQYNDAFRSAAFALSAGQVLTRALDVNGSWFIGKVTGHEVRALSESALSSRISQNFTDWLQAQATRMKKLDIWVERVPSDPAPVSSGQQ